MAHTGLILQSIDQTFYRLTIFQIYFNRNPLIFITFKRIQLFPILGKMLRYKYITLNSLARITELNARATKFSPPATLLQMPTDISGFPASPNPLHDMGIGLLRTKRAVYESTMHLKSSDGSFRGLLYK